MINATPALDKYEYVYTTTRRVALGMTTHLSVICPGLQWQVVSTSDVPNAVSVVSVKVDESPLSWRVLYNICHEYAKAQDASLKGTT